MSNYMAKNLVFYLLMTMIIIIIIIIIIIVIIIIIIIRNFYSLSRARVYQPTAHLTSTCPQTEVKDHPASPLASLF